MRSARKFARAVSVSQRLPHMIFARIDGTGTASVLEGSHELVLTDNGVGDYTLTFAQSFGRIPTVVCTLLTTNTYAMISTVSTTAVRILVKQVADGSTATDADFHVLISGCDAADEV